MPIKSVHKQSEINKQGINQILKIIIIHSYTQTVLYTSNWVSIPWFKVKKGNDKDV